METRKEATIPSSMIELMMDDKDKVQFLLQELENLKSLVQEKNNEIYELKNKEDSGSSKEKSPRKRSTLQFSPHKWFFKNDNNLEDLEKTKEILYNLNISLQLINDEQRKIIQKLQDKVADLEKSEITLNKQKKDLSNELSASLDLCKELKDELFRFQAPKEPEIYLDEKKIDLNKPIEPEKDQSPKKSKSRSNSPRKYPIHVLSKDNTFEELKNKYEQRYSLSSELLKKIQILEENPFEKYMKNTEIFKKYQSMLKKEACEENLLFYTRVKEFSKNFENIPDKVKMVKEIYETFLKKDAPYEININEDYKTRLLLKIQKNEIKEDIFLDCYNHVISIMMGDSFLRFKLNKEVKHLFQNEM